MSSIVYVIQIFVFLESIKAFLHVFFNFIGHSLIIVWILSDFIHLMFITVVVEF
jgi:hypothetical protein